MKNNKKIVVCLIDGSKEVYEASSYAVKNSSVYIHRVEKCPIKNIEKEVAVATIAQNITHRVYEVCPTTKKPVGLIGVIPPDGNPPAPAAEEE